MVVVLVHSGDNVVVAGQAGEGELVGGVLARGAPPPQQLDGPALALGPHTPHPGLGARTAGVHPGQTHPLAGVYPGRPGAGLVLWARGSILLHTACILKFERFMGEP